MPIRPENRDRYPDDWKAISNRIRFVRARARCECRGECGHDHDPYGAGLRTDYRCRAVHMNPHPVTGSNVILTVAHLDHQPEHCDDRNLRAMCQRCHLAYDRDHHAQTRQETRNGRMG